MTDDSHAATIDRDDPLAKLASDLEAELHRDRPQAELQQRCSTPNSAMKATGYNPAAAAGRPLRGGSERPPQILKGPPLTGQISAPLALLAEVAEHARVVHAEVRELAAALTGEMPVERHPPSPLTHAVGTLPRVVQLATEIDVSHAQIALLVEHMRRLLS